MLRNSAHATLIVVAFFGSASAFAADGNRLTYLDENDPYYVSRTFPKLTTPQWVGEDGVEAVVVLAIDDMRNPEQYESFLRPILRRLRQIDGRTPLSIMTCKVEPRSPRLQEWLKEGLSLEIHTIDHPCPLLADGNFAKARSTYERCVDLLNDVPGNHPVAFRVPCCDSLNTPSPRFYAEIFNRTTAKGNFLTIDSSVFNIFTANDTALPREVVLEPDGQERFRKYIPKGRSFVNTIEDYPYPYVLDGLCWEFPCVVPSDWEAFFLQKANNPRTVDDLKKAIDATVLKQGVFDLVFHPHGWIKSEQVVELIDYAVAKHGKKVKFLTFREAQDRLNKNLLGGQPLRSANGQDNGVRLIDLNNDGFLDVVIGNDKVQQTRLWSPQTQTWIVSTFPTQLVKQDANDNSFSTHAHCGVFRPDGHASLLVRSDWIFPAAGAWHFDGQGWVEAPELLAGLEIEGKPVVTGRDGIDRGVRLRDLDKDGRCELIVSNYQQQAVFSWSPEKNRWTMLPFALPAGASLVNEEGMDNGVRFVDLDEDGHNDVIFSNEQNYGLSLFSSMKNGWSRQVSAGRQRDKGALPMIARAGTNNGAWFHSRHMWVNNENTNLLKDHVDRRSFNELLQNVEPTAKSPSASLHSIRVHPGFEVELVAAEPLVQSPIAFAWGPDGKLWVVEMGDYPLGVDGKGKPGGKIKFLESTRGDGIYDKATVFLDNLSFPTGVMPWRKGVLVTCAPEIFYAEDTDGDGKADLRVSLYTGFGLGNQQHRVNSLVWGLDNWIHCANGDSNGAIRSVKTGATVDISGRDLRIRPDTGDLDPQSGRTQYGLSRDDWDNWFGNNNSNPMWYYALADHYLRRNPHLAAPNPRVQISVVPGASRVYPVSRTLPRFNDPGVANHFTSACSAIVYRDDLFGPAFANNTFVSEPVHNLIHREIMTPSGVTFTSHRAADEEQSEFLASSDNWFRPTMIQTGPDGALWVADMYRQVIEHPEWIPKDWQKRLDLRAGHDKGRIYRIYPVGHRPRPMPRLAGLDAAGVVAALDSSSGWQRDLAQQLLVQRQDQAAVPLLENLATKGTRPLARVHSLCTLDGLHALSAEVLGRLLTDADPGVRRQAVRLCEPAGNPQAPLLKAPALGDALVGLVEDPSAPVREQLAYSLGEWDDPRAGKALGQLALKDAGNPYFSAAIMSSVNAKNLDAVLLEVVTAGKDDPVPPAVIENLLRMAHAFGDKKAMVVLLNAIGQPKEGKVASWQFSALAGLLDALEQRGTSLAKTQMDDAAALQASQEQLAGLFAAARALVADSQSPRAERLQAVRLLGRGLDRQREDMAILADLLTPQVGDDFQIAAVATLARLRDPKVPELLLRNWRSYGPGLRSQVLGALLGRSEWQKTLLDAIERGQVPASEIGAASRQRLLDLKDAALRIRAVRVFQGAVDRDRDKLVRAHQPVLTMPGDAGRGRLVFAKACATCHKLGGVGHEVGPDLGSVGDKSPGGLLIAILDPNRSVEARYVNYQAITKNGVTLTGVLASETGASITLVGPEGKQQVVLRKDLEELVSSGKSAMPEGLEKDLKPQDLADLIAHIRSATPQPKRKLFDDNQPAVIRPDADGSLSLPANAASIYGESLVLEKEYGNLGYWSSQDDHAVWSIDVPKAGTFAVWFDWSCANDSAGNSFMLETGLERLTGTVAGTGSWDSYRQAKVGEIVLQSGKQVLTMRGLGKIKGALIDLKMIRLIPINAK